MENILIILDNIGAAVGQFRGAMATSLKVIDNQKEQLAVVKSRQEKKDQELIAREKEIKKVEDVIALSKYNDDMGRELSKKNSQFIQAKQEFENHYAAKIKELSEREQKVDIREGKNVNETKALKAMKDALETEKAEFKIKLAQKLVDQVENKKR